MIFVERSGPSGRLRSAKIMNAERHAAPARSPQSGRSEAQERRSRLTAAGRRGRSVLTICGRGTVTARKSVLRVLALYLTTPSQESRLAAEKTLILIENAQDLNRNVYRQAYGVFRLRLFTKKPAALNRNV